MIIALSTYGVALLVRTAEDAFASVDTQVHGAAIAIGNSPRSVFWRVDLPLAMPVIVPGIRVVAVSTIALVTIGALVGVPSLGTLLTDGFQRGIIAEVATGIVATVILALLLDGALLLTGANSGIQAIDPAISQGAKAIGMSPAQVIIGVELPLASPTIVGGIRAATLQVVATATLALLGTIALTGCSTSNPLDNEGANESTDQAAGQSTGFGPIVIGPQDYYSNGIIAEVCAQALENAGYEVDREFRIGQREAYLPEIESGQIDLFPEYTGNLLQYWEPDTSARLSDDVYEELSAATPDGLVVLDQAPATDQDSHTVTRAFADKWGLATIDDLAQVKEPMTLGAL